MAWNLVINLAILAVGIAARIIIDKRQRLKNQPRPSGEFPTPTSTEGRAVPIVWGTARLDGPNLLWYGDSRREEIVARSRSVRLLTRLIDRFGQEVVVGHRYFYGLQYGLCEGPIERITRVWLNGRRVFQPDNTGGSGMPGGIISQRQTNFYETDNGIDFAFRVFPGDPVQSASSYLQPFQEIAGEQLTYANTAYVAPVSEPMYIGNSRESLPSFSFEVVRLPPLPPGGNILHRRVNPGTLPSPSVPDDIFADANPAHVLYEILTNTKWGHAIPSNDIDVASFNEAAEILFDEGNGFSYFVDAPTPTDEIIDILETQIDGVMFQDPVTTLWKLRLIRAGDGSDAIGGPIDDESVIEFTNFSRTTWQDTVNHLSLEFQDRDDNYKTTYAGAQDMANVRTTGQRRSQAIRFPGVKNRDLANNLVWRELVQLSRPLATVEVVVNRTFYAVQPGDKVRVQLSALRLNTFNQNFRVASVDQGDLLNGRIRLQLSQDIFDNQIGAFNPPDGTLWEQPEETLIIPAPNDAFIQEAPRNLQPVGEEDSIRILYATRRAAGENQIRLLTNDTATPENFILAGVSGGSFMLIGTLGTEIRPVDGGISSTVTFEVIGTPDTTSIIRDRLDLALDPIPGVELGESMNSVLAIGNEFFLVSSVSTAGPNLQFTAFRSVLDSVPEMHAENTLIFLLYSKYSVTDLEYTDGQNLEVKTQPVLSDGSTLPEETLPLVTTIDIDQRSQRPYPPSVLYAYSRASNNVWLDDVDLDFQGTDPDSDIGFEIFMNRRDYRERNETPQLAQDAAVIGTETPAFPGANSTEHSISFFRNPDTAPEIVTTIGAGQNESVFIPRSQILQGNDGALPARLEVRVEATHTVTGVGVLTSRYSTRWVFDVSSELGGLFALGNMTVNDASNAYNAEANDDYRVSLTGTPVGGDVEYRLNGGSWTTLIDVTSNGVITGVLASDQIELRHTGVGVGLLGSRFIDITRIGTSTRVAYGLIV